MSQTDLIKRLSVAIFNQQPIEYIASDAIATDGIVVIEPSVIRTSWMILIAPDNVPRLLEMIPEAKTATVVSV